ncbi:MAG: hypothetical protein A2219_04745 [Elusimicrobia bacterium RIFOXYA2_FULL_50_26]|nr:MAG: hypothetical protein A2219_04745 [Elusimicrobia bacterium RIFOXYA2_FULL_50_26]OGS24920.1 MAG: hypothetical protein A2314_08970 [Elusimicrobia bacterium RIFOXYB2_FULL_50_12]
MFPEIRETLNPRAAAILLFSVIFSALPAFASWVPVPLRTAAMRDAGLPGGEGMQMIWGISYAPSNPDVIYICSDTSQVWKSIDAGETWQMKNNGFFANGGVSLAVSPVDENLVFVAGSNHNTTVSPAEGIYRTTNGGQSWEIVKPTKFYRTDNMKGGVNFSFTPAGTVYAGTHVDGILRSDDNGSSWASLSVSTDAMVLDIKVDPADAARLYFVSENGFFVLHDSGTGVSAVRSGAGLPLPDVSSSVPRAIAINNSDPRIIYVSAGGYGIYKSTDGGATFVPKNKGLTATLANGKQTTCCAISPVDPMRLYVSFYLTGVRQPYYSSDGGENWVKPSGIDLANLTGDLHDSNDSGAYWGTPIAPHPSLANVSFARGTGSGVPINTTDGGATWLYSGDGYSGGRAGAGATSFGWDVNDPERFVIFLIDYGPMLTTDGGQTFRTLKIPRYSGAMTTPAGALEPVAGSQRIVTAVGGWDKQVLAVTNNEGESWTQIPVDKYGNSTEDSYKFIAFHPQDPSIVYAGCFKSFDGGATWEKLSKKVAAVYPANGDIVYAVEKITTSVIYKSGDGGATWTGLTAPLAATVSEMAVDPGNEDHIYAACSVGVCIWDGSAWTTKTDADGLERDWFSSLNTRYITVDQRYPNIIYAGKWCSWQGHSNGVFRSQDYGATWENITGKLGPEFTPWSLSVNPHSGEIYMGSSHGTWKLTPPYYTKPVLSPKKLQVQ